MIKFIIADDEPHFRRYMNTVLDWENLGFEICSSCKNAKEVLECMDLLHPAAALLDINMPGMDGLLLAEKLKQMNPNIIIVFVTGHAEFEYAKRAIQLGVDEYLLKPFSREELTEIMNKIKMKLHKESEDRYVRKFDCEIVKEELLKRLIHDVKKDRAEKEFLTNLKRVGIVFKEPYFRAAAIEFETVTEMRNRQEDIGLWKFAIVNIGEELIGSHKIHEIAFLDYEDRIMMILNERTDQNVKEICFVFDKLISKVKELLLIDVSVGIGGCYKDLEGIRLSYQNAMRALEEKFFQGAGQVHLFEPEKFKEREAHFYRLEVNDRLLNALRKNNTAELKIIMEETKAKMIEKEIAADYAYMIVSGMLSICLSYIAEMNGDIAQIFGRDFSPYFKLYRTASIEESFSFLEEVLLKASNSFSMPYSKRGAQILDQVEQFIKEHYQDYELSVEEIAKGVFLDSSYVRRVVSRQAGCTVSDLITSIRMNAGKKLLEEQYLSVGQIAEAVGYAEPGYFSKCFKKFFGITPTEYTNKFRKESF